MASLTEIVERALQIATGRGIDPFKSPVADAGMTVEALVPHCIRRVLNRAVHKDGVLDLLEEHTITLGNNEYGHCPDRILRQHLKDSYINDDAYASFVSMADYNRSRYDNLLTYYAVHGNKLYYSGEITLAVRDASVSSTVSDNSITVTGDASSASVGDRFYLEDTTNEPSPLVFNAYIATINGTTDFTIHGKSLNSASSLNGVIYDGLSDISQRTISTGGTTTANANTYSATGAAFTYSDVGRRLRVMRESAPSTVVIDAIITGLTSSTAVTLGAEALFTETNASATVYDVAPLKITAPSVPAITDATSAINIPSRVVEDTILLLAGALTGEVKIDSLLNEQ